MQVRRLNNDIVVPRAGTDAQAAIGQAVDPAQLGDLAEVDQIAQILELLVHPQADVGAAGKPSRLRPGGARLRQFVERARRVEVVDAAAEGETPAHPFAALAALKRAGGQ